MKPSNQVVWGIHAGRTGDADELFLKNNCIAVGWEVGDLRLLGKDREIFKKFVMTTYPNIKTGAIPNVAGQIPVYS